MCRELQRISGMVLQIKHTIKTHKFVDYVQGVTENFGNVLTKKVQHRMEKAYPNIEKERIIETEEHKKESKVFAEGCCFYKIVGLFFIGAFLGDITETYPNIEKERIIETEEHKKESKVFAEGCCFYKIVGLFFIGAFLGDITETIFCRITAGRWMSRSSVVYGPFSIVWGLGCACLTAFLYKYKDKSDRYIFLYGTVLGGAYEYICSVFTELVFGTVFWDYSKIPFNLGGRINLLFCFFWGIAAVVWLKILYPVFSGWIEKLPKKGGKIIMWAAIVFMIINMLISALALYRYNDRIENPVPKNNLEKILDERFDDERMDRIYPNAKRGR